MDKKSKDKRTALHLALRLPRLNEDRPFSNIHKVLKNILSVKKVDVNLEDQNKQTPLHYAVDLADAPSVEMLLKAGAKVDVQDNKGRTPLHVAADLKAKGRKYQEAGMIVIPMLLGKGADRNIKDGKGKLAVELAISVPMKRLLLTPQQRVAADQQLMGAAEQGNLAGIKAAFAKGANVNAQNAQGNTALMLAAYNGHVSVVKHLLNSRADRTIKNHAGQTAYDLAKTNKKTAVVKLVVPSAVRGTANKKLLNAAQTKNLKLLQEALASQAQVNVWDGTGKTALHYAVNDMNILRALLATPGLRLDIRDRQGNTVLHLAAAQGNVAIAQALLGAGADRVALDASGNTPQEVAQAKGKTVAAQMVRPTAERAAESAPTAFCAPLPTAGATARPCISEHACIRSQWSCSSEVRRIEHRCVLPRGETRLRTCSRTNRDRSESSLCERRTCQTPPGGHTNPFCRLRPDPPVHRRPQQQERRRTPWPQPSRSRAPPSVRSAGRHVHERAASRHPRYARRTRHCLPDRVRRCAARVPPEVAHLRQWRHGDKALTDALVPGSPIGARAA